MLIMLGEMLREQRWQMALQCKKTPIAAAAAAAAVVLANHHRRDGA
jgi:hypothetical protein